MVELRNNIRGSANVRLVDFHILTHSQTLLRCSFFPRDFSMWDPGWSSRRNVQCLAFHRLFLRSFPLSLFAYNLSDYFTYLYPSTIPMSLALELSRHFGSKTRGSLGIGFGDTRFTFAHLRWDAATILDTTHRAILE